MNNGSLSYSFSASINNRDYDGNYDCSSEQDFIYFTSSSSRIPILRYFEDSCSLLLDEYKNEQYISTTSHTSSLLSSLFTPLSLKSKEDDYTNYKLNK